MTRAATIDVSCSAVALIAAVNQANSTGANDTLELTSGCTYTLTAVNNDGNGPNGLPVIVDASSAGSLTIHGNGATIERSTGSSTPDFRIIHINGGGNLSLDNLTLRNGRLPTGSGDLYGGGIFNEGGSLTVTNSTFADNFAPNDGGGINSGGTLVVRDSFFTGNHADGLGGGILVGQGTAIVDNSSFTDNEAYGPASGGGILNGGFLASTLTVTNSTFVNNYGDGGGGGLFNSGEGTLNLINSTVTGNTAFDGGGLWNSGVLNVINSTISGNEASHGGGLYNRDSGTTTFKNSILANSPSGVDCERIAGTINAFGANIIEIGSNCVTSGNTPITNDPLLGSLTLNAPGETQTMALLAGSPAIDAADDCTNDADNNPNSGGDLSTDQRGVSRPRDGDNNGTYVCDLGAFETGTAPPVQESNQSSGPAPEEVSVDNFLASNVSEVSAGAITVSAGSATKDGSEGGIYATVLVQDGALTPDMAAQIGDPEVLALGVTQAVNLYGLLPGGVPADAFVVPVHICMRGSGSVLWLHFNSATQKREVTGLSSTQEGGNTCADVPGAGIVVLDGPQAQAAPTAAPVVEQATTTTALTNCTVTTQYKVNLRADSSTDSPTVGEVPYNLSLQATATENGWVQVVFEDGQGWIRADLVSTSGDCGG